MEYDNRGIARVLFHGFGAIPRVLVSSGGGRGAAGETKEDDGRTRDEPSPGLLELMAMSEMSDFRVNKSKDSKGCLPLFLSVGLYVGDPSYEDALAFVLAYTGVNPNIAAKKN